MSRRLDALFAERERIATTAIFTPEGSVKYRNCYGMYGDFTSKCIPIGGEDLAAKLIFPDRIIRVGWDGRIEVEPTDG